MLGAFLCIAIGAGSHLDGIASARPHRRAVVVDSGEASRLKSQYPFVRFAVLTGDLPAAVPLHDRVLPLRPRPGEGARLITPDARAFHGKPVSIRGYMIPLAVDARGVHAFVLSSSIDSCHFGLVGGMNEWVDVRLAADARVPAAGLSPVTVFGTLDVGEQVQNGAVTSIYRMQAEFLAIH